MLVPNAQYTFNLVFMYFQDLILISPMRMASHSSPGVASLLFASLRTNNLMSNYQYGMNINLFSIGINICYIFCATFDISFSPGWKEKQSIGISHARQPTWDLVSWEFGKLMVENYPKMDFRGFRCPRRYYGRLSFFLPSKGSLLGKPLSTCLHLYLGIAQIAITPPPRTQTGTLGHFFSGAILPFYHFYHFSYHFFTIFSE